MLLAPALFVTFLALSACQAGYTGQVDTITLATPELESNGLFWIAQDRQMFARNGLNVIVIDADAGISAMDAVLRGEADIAGLGEFPVVQKALQKAGLSVPVCTVKMDYVFVEARADRGIRQVSDLKGKKVGAVSGTIANFFLGRFLELNGVSREALTLVNVPTAAGSVDAIVNGSVDAIVVSEPYATRIRERLGENSVTWPAQSSQPMYGLMVSTEEWTQRHPDQAARFLRSLAQAEEYLLHNPAELEAGIAKHLHVDANFTHAAMSRNRFSLTLDQSLITAMEDEARWMIKSNLTAETQVPNFLDYVYVDGLRAIKPDAVNIIR
jgi:ABC-type nitrate/sulfonate/bicarbonate transport system substrate-binding protein